MLFAAGLALVLYYGDLWWRLPLYSAADLEQSAELNLMLDLQRDGVTDTSTVSAAMLESRRQQLKAEVENEVLRERREVQRGFATGAALTVFSLAQMVWMRQRSRKAP